MEQFWINKRGEEIHEGLVREDEKLRDQMVNDIIKKVQAKRKDLEEFKHSILDDIKAYNEILREKYKMNPKRETKGNMTFDTYDGKKRVQIAVQSHIEFSSTLNLAKEKIDDFLKAETKNASDTLKTLVMKVFEVDKKGNVNSKKILSLKSYNIQDPLWVEAMGIIDDALEIVGSKSYIRFYERQNSGEKFKNISLSFSDI